MKQQNMIGVLGGMGPQASVEFYRLLIEKARHRYGAHENDEYPEILIDSVPAPDFLANTARMEQAAQLLENRVEKLTAYGVTALTIVCNTACILLDRLQKQTPVPIISVVDEVVKTVSKDTGPVLLLASPTSLNLGLYQLALARLGIDCIVPTKKEFKELELIIRGVIEGIDRRDLMRRLVKLTERNIAKQPVKGIVLGCTELPLIFPMNFRLPVHSSLSILADETLKRYYRKENL